MNNSKNLEIEKTIDTAQRCYENKEYDKAFALCKEAENNNAPRAYYLLGVMYLLGRGVSKDRQTAMSYFEKVKTMADNNNPHAQKSLGDMYRNNYGVKLNSQEAIRWWKKVAQQGHIEAQYELGFALYPPCYMDNKEDKQNGLM